MLKRVRETKDSLRKRILKLLRDQKEEERLEKSQVIRNKLFASREFKRSKAILFYASVDGEVETFEMMKQAKEMGKQIALPIIIKDRKTLVPSRVENLQEELMTGSYGVKEPKSCYFRPVDFNGIDLVIVPGVAFDKDNHRLGRGAGYYDRFLGKLSKPTPSIGLAFDFQIVNRLPHLAKHDIPVTRIIVN